MAIVIEDRSRLEELPAGAMFYSTSGEPDSQGLVKGMCRGQMVLIFQCDLEERGEPLARNGALNWSDPASPMIFSASQPAEIDDDGHQ